MRRGPQPRFAAAAAGPSASARCCLKPRTHAAHPRGAPTRRTHAAHPRGAPTRRTHAVTHVVHPRGVAANSNVPKRSQRVAGEVKSSALVNLQTGSNQMFGAAYRTETAVRPARKARAGDMARICRQCVRLTRGNQASHKVLLDQKLQMWKMSNTQFQLLSSHHDENNDENLMSFEHHFAY